MTPGRGIEAKSAREADNNRTSSHPNGKTTARVGPPGPRNVAQCRVILSATTIKTQSIQTTNSFRREISQLCSTFRMPLFSLAPSTEGQESQKIQPAQTTTSTQSGWFCQNGSIGTKKSLPRTMYPPKVETLVRTWEESLSSNWLPRPSARHYLLRQTSPGIQAETPGLKSLKK